MKKENRAYIENNKKQEYAINKTSKFFSFTSILKLTLALALFLMAALFINAGNVIVENGALNVSNNLLVNTNTLYADSANNRVGIGTTSPSKLLTLKSDSGQLRIETSSDAANYYATLHSPYNSNHPFNLSVANGGVLAEYLGVYADGGANNRVVFPTGNVGIGTSSPTAALDVRSAVSIGANAATTGSLRLPAEGYIYARNAANTADIFMVGLSADDVYLGHINPNIYFRTADGSTRMTIDSTGDIGIGTTSPTSGIELDVEGQAECDGAGCWTVESDLSLKENIIDMTKYGLNEVMQIKPREYDYKETGNHSFGFIAQELKNVVPEIVYGEEGNMSIGYGGLTPILVKAMQEQQKQIEELKARVAALESK